MGFSDMDALHIAAAKKGETDFFITCDDSILNFYKRDDQITKVRIMNLLEFVTEEVK
jgi:predicted nucleic acid-binding protein